ncbi:HopJ type III effector protein [Autumnicola musiva]|uniref:HopJ type III effector protein n=1 Tax=Autumnicola musiva TaxID=3075589 RepID=A0ABU3D4E7_9FLAO|nr:HopJ type III effector protein [Zunongwangia sp. F117]MDT0676374.1 HopJ type III effector protein [Zunongwangia sp. F117]
MKTEEFLNFLKENPRANTFGRTMEVIDKNYYFTPVAFKNGQIKNAAGENNGSCKIFYFAKRNNLNKEETLACFGEVYFEQVLKQPNGEGHQNIRNFMKSGWEGIHFKETALQPK